MLCVVLQADAKVAAATQAAGAAAEEQMQWQQHVCGFLLLARSNVN
jgi:hypothetical protein